MRTVAVCLVLKEIILINLVSCSLAGRNNPPSQTPHDILPSTLPKAEVKNEWKPDPHLLSKLAPETKVGDYGVRLPSGYSSFPTPAELMTHKPFAEGGIKAYQYTSRTYSDGIASVISFHIFSAVYIAYINDFSEAPLDTKSLTESWLSVQREVELKRNPGIVFSPEEYGQMSGLYFIRQYAQYTKKMRGKKFKVHRFTYISLSVAGGIEASFYDSEPHSKVTLPVAEASILTFHKD